MNVRVVNSQRLFCSWKTGIEEVLYLFYKVEWHFFSKPSSINNPENDELKPGIHYTEVKKISSYNSSAYFLTFKTTLEDLLLIFLE